MNIKSKTLVLFLTLTFLVPSLSPSKAAAMDKDVKAVIVAGTYGLAAGTLVGFALFPFTKKNRSIFLGSSIGLYLGIAVGLYFIANRYDPNNPLSPNYDSPNYDNNGQEYWQGDDESMNYDSERFRRFRADADYAYPLVSVRLATF